MGPRRAAGLSGLAPRPAVGLAPRPASCGGPLWPRTPARGWPRPRPAVGLAPRPAGRVVARWAIVSGGRASTRPLWRLTGCQPPIGPSGGPGAGCRRPSALQVARASLTWLNAGRARAGGNWSQLEAVKTACAKTRPRSSQPHGTPSRPARTASRRAPLPGPNRVTPGAAPGPGRRAPLPAPAAGRRSRPRPPALPAPAAGAPGPGPGRGRGPSVRAAGRSAHPTPTTRHRRQRRPRGRAG